MDKMLFGTFAIGGSRQPPQVTLRKKAVMMTTTDTLGYLAASLVLATFCAKTMIPLRGLAITSNFAFIAYALAAHLWPILLLHAIMLPLNAARLWEALDPNAMAAIETAAIPQSRDRLSRPFTPE